MELTVEAAAIGVATFGYVSSIWGLKVIDGKICAF